MKKYLLIEVSHLFLIVSLLPSNVVEKAAFMNLYVSRNGQTFGPYTFEQAKHFFDSNQLKSPKFSDQIDTIRGNTSEHKMF